MMGQRELSCNSPHDLSDFKERVYRQHGRAPDVRLWSMQPQDRFPVACDLQPLSLPAGCEPVFSTPSPSVYLVPEFLVPA